MFPAIADEVASATAFRKFWFRGVQYFGRKVKVYKDKRSISIRTSNSDPCLSWMLWRYLIRREVGVWWNAVNWKELKISGLSLVLGVGMCIQTCEHNFLVQERHEKLLYGKVNEAQNNVKEEKGVLHWSKRSVVEKRPQRSKNLQSFVVTKYYSIFYLKIIRFFFSCC